MGSATAVEYEIEAGLKVKIRGFAGAYLVHAHAGRTQNAQADA